MKTSLALACLSAVALPALAACANPSRASAADDLRAQLTGMSGVVSVDLDYTEPIPLDSGKLALHVEMEAEASADEIRKVVATAYRAFEDVHHREEGDLDVAIGDDIIHLRSFEPDADTADVADAAEWAVAVFAAGTIRADINTQDVAAAPHVHTRYDVTIPEADVASLLSALSGLEAQHAGIPDAGWTVRAGGEEGWGLSAQEGFPDQSQRDRLDQLRVGLPAGATIWLGEYDNILVRLAADTPPAVAAAVASRHLALLGGPGKAFYDIQQGGDLLAMILQGDCFFDTGAAGVLLEKEHAGECTKVTHPDPT